MRAPIVLTEETPTEIVHAVHVLNAFELWAETSPEGTLADWYGTHMHEFAVINRMLLAADLVTLGVYDVVPAMPEDLRTEFANLHRAMHEHAVDGVPEYVFDSIPDDGTDLNRLPEEQQVAEERFQAWADAQQSHELD